MEIQLGLTSHISSNTSAHQVSEWHDYSQNKAKKNQNKQHINSELPQFPFHVRHWRRPSLSRKMWLSLQLNLDVSPKQKVYNTSYSKPRTFNFGMMDRHTDTSSHQENHSTACLGPNPSSPVRRASGQTDGTVMVQEPRRCPINPWRQSRNDCTECQELVTNKKNGV